MKKPTTGLTVKFDQILHEFCSNWEILMIEREISLKSVENFFALSGRKNDSIDFNSSCDPLTIQIFLKRLGPPPILIDHTLHEIHFTLPNWTVR